MEPDIEAFRARLYDLRTKKRISARALSMAIGRSEAYIQGLESGLRNKEVPREPIVRSIARELGTTVDFLVYGIAAGQQDEPEKKPKRRYTLAEILRNIGAWPVVNNAIRLEQQASAGKGRGALIPQGLEGVETVPIIEDGQLYAMRVTGNCMVPEVKPGEIVHFDPDRTPEDGDLVVATQDGEKALVKWYEDQGTMQYLVPLEGEPILIDESIEVIGVIKKIERNPPRRTNAKRKRTVSPLQRPLLDE